MKKITLILSLLLIFSFSTSAFAQEISPKEVTFLDPATIQLKVTENTIIFTPQRSSVFSYYKCNIDYTDTSILCSSQSTLKYSASQSITMKLQKYNGSSWVTLKSWNDSTIGTFLNLKESNSKSSGKYRVLATHIADGEAVLSYSPTITIK